MEKPSKLKVQLLSENAFLPKRGTKNSSGIDVFSPYNCFI